MSTSSRLNIASFFAPDSKRFDASKHIASSPIVSPHMAQRALSLPMPLRATSDGGFSQEAESAQDETEFDSRHPLAVHDILLLSSVAPEESLAREAAKDLDPRIATCTEELCAHLETERFKLIVVECEKGATDMVRQALETHRQLPSDDRTALIAFTQTQEGGLDLLRYTPDATAFAFLAAQKHQLRAHFLKLLNV